MTTPPTPAPLSFAFGGLLVGLCLGLVIGRSLVRPTQQAPLAPPPPPTAAPAASSTPLRCVQVDDGSRDSLEQAQARLQICERLVAAQARPRPRVDVASGEPSEAERADAWTDALDEAARACGLDDGLEVAECSRYPCVGLVDDADPGLEACLEGRLDSRGLPEVHILPVEVDCGQGDLRTVTTVVAVDPDSEAYEDVGDSDSMEALMGAFVHFGGRVQDALALYPCDADSR